MSQSVKTALVAGASRGLGLGLVRAYLAQGWRVVATRRGAAAELEALQRESGGGLVVETLDVTDEASIAALRERLAGERLDLLFVCAGVALDRTQPACQATDSDFATLMLTNALAPLRVIEALAGLVPRDGVIGAMSSVLGSVASNTGGGYEVYRASKAALNTLLLSYAARNRGRGVIALHPGWVRTEMGGADATLGVAESVAGMVDVLNGRAGKPGCVFLDYQGKTIPW